MVHSGFSSPMKTSALPLPASSAVPPAPTAVSTEQSSPQTPIKPDSSKVSTLNPSNAEAPVINASFTASSTLIATPAQPAFNGRTSGRKRTPKSCDCCGPKGHGHNVSKGHGHTVQTPNRGRGRPRGRARGSGNVAALEETPKRKLGGLLTHAKSPHLTDKQFGKVIGAEMGVDDSSQNFTEMPDLHGVATNAAPSDIKDVQIEKSLTANESVKYNDIEMKVADKPVVLVQNSRTVMASTTTAGEIKRKMDDNVLCSNIQISFKKQAKLEQEEQADPKPLPQNGESNSPTNCLQSCGKAGGATHVTNGPITVATKPVHISAVDLTSAEQNSENTNDVPLSLSNGDSFAAVPLDDTQEVIITADLQNSRPVPVPPKEPISVRSEVHPRALHDHSVYCRLGTWVKTEETGETGDEDLQEQEEEGEQLLEMVHEFLESFYVKYGSFIPLAENDVVEHLKQKGKSDLTDKAVDIEKQVTRYRAGLASAPVAGFAVAHNRHTLSLEDLSTLEEQNWINDQIINMYGELIMEATEQKVHFFNSFFHKQLVAKGYEGVKRWTKKIDLFSKWLVLIPIHLEIHWSLVTVSMAHKTISYYDSQGIVFRHTTENIMKYLLAEAKEKKQTAFQKGWKITIVKGIPQQKNDSDCGVFVLEYCRCLSVKQPFRFSQEDMPRIRKRIYKELCDCHLSEAAHSGHT